MSAEKLRGVAKQVLPRTARVLLDRLESKRRALVPHRFAFASAPGRAHASPFPYIVADDNPLEALGAKYQPSKRQHNYLKAYWMHLRDIRMQVRSVLEIGVQSDRSLRMWEEFFPNADIYGIDIDPDCERFSGGRRRVFIGDQSDPEFLEQVSTRASAAFDVIIDDGSHRVQHQLATFDALFPRMSDHGIYVVEDTGGCVGDPQLQTVNALKTLVDSIMYWPPALPPDRWSTLSELPSEASWADRNIVGVAFYRWIVFIMRGKNPQDNPYLGG